MIRQLAKQDFKQVQDLYKQLYKIHFVNRPDIFFDRHTMTAKYFEEIFDAEDKFCIVYEKENKIVGVALCKINQLQPTVNLKPRTIYEIYEIVVQENERLNNIGHELFNYIENLAIKNKIDAVEVSVWSFNRPAINFYETLGMNAKKVTYEKLLNPEYCEKTQTTQIRITDKVI